MHQPGEGEEPTEIAAARHGREYAGTRAARRGRYTGIIRDTWVWQVVAPMHAAAAEKK